MKVLIDPEIFKLQHFGGISLYTSKLLEYYEKQNNIDAILPLFYSDNQYIKELDFIKYHSLYTEKFPFKKQIIKYMNRINKINTIKELKKQKFDVYHPSYFDNYFFKYIKNKPYVITVHDMTIEALSEYFIFDKYYKPTLEKKKKLIENSSRIIAISQNTKNDIIKFCDYPEDKIDVIHHGLPLKSIDLNNNKLYEELPKKYILYIGQRTKYKNFLVLLEAVSTLLKEDKDLHLICAGGPNFNKTEKEILKFYSIEKQVIRMQMSSDEDLITYYKNALCFVYPSLYEGFGFPIIEAYQTGCPLVCSNTSVFPEIAANGAVYFDPYDSNSIKESIKKTIEDREFAKNKIEIGKQQIERFDWNTTAQKTIESYQKALE